MEYDIAIFCLNQKKIIIIVGKTKWENTDIDDDKKMINKMKYCFCHHPNNTLFLFISERNIRFNVLSVNRV